MGWEKILKYKRKRPKKRWERDKKEEEEDKDYDIRMPNACPKCRGDLVSQGWDRWSYTCEKCGRSYQIDGDL